VGAVLVAERERGLVAMVTVGDQELRVPQGLLDRRGVGHAPEPRDDTAVLRLERRRAFHVQQRRALVEQEDRLELGAGRAQQPQPTLLRTGVRALVRQDDPLFVWLDL